MRTTAELVPVGPSQKDFYSYPEVTAPNFSRWRSSAKFLLTGFVRSQPDGRFAVGCYVYDVTTGREAGRTGFVVAPDEWRRAAHKCSGLAYTAADWRRPVAVLLGNEGAGLSPGLLGHADTVVSIPLRGRVESLNVGVAAGLLLFEAARQRAK